MNLVNPFPLVDVRTGPPAGDSSLSTQNDEEENQSVNSAGLSHYSKSDHSLPNPEDYYATTNTTSANTNSQLQYQHQQHQQQQQQEKSTSTPRHSNRSRTLSNSEAVVNATRTTTAGIVDSNKDDNNSNSMTNQLIIRITTRPIMSWSPQVIHADGSSHTMTIDLPEEFAHNHRTLVITQQGWQDLYHIIVTAVAKNTSESILLFWITGFLLMVMAFILLFGLVKGITARLGVLLGVLGATSLIGIAHSVVRRFRVHIAVRKCVEECFYDAEASAIAAATNAAAIDMDVEQQQQNTNDGTANEIDRSMGGILDGLQGLEDVVNIDGDAGDTGDTDGGFGRVVRQRLNSHSSSHSHTNLNTNDIGNRQRINTDGGDSTVTSSSNMIFNEEGPRRNRAVSRDGMYCVNWKWEYLGMDAVVKISWE